MTKENTELAIFQQITALQIFKENKGDEFLSKLEKEVEEFIKNESDMTTDKGKKRIRSYAYEISQYKSPLKETKLEITEEVRITLKKLNAEDNRLQDEIQRLQDKVRKPLTDFEKKEKERVDIRQHRISELENASFVASNNQTKLTPVEFYEEVLINLEDLLKFDWQEFSFKAETTYNNSKTEVENKLREAKELAALKKEKEEREERDKKDRENQIRREAADNARQLEIKKAQKKEEAAEAEIYKLEAEKKAAEQANIDEKAEKERVEYKLWFSKRLNELSNLGLKYDFKDSYILENINVGVVEVKTLDEEEWKELINKLNIEIDRRKKQEEKEEKEKAKIQAQKDTDNAIKAEQARVNAVKEAEIKAEKAREANLKHRHKIHTEILLAMSEFHGGNQEEAKLLINAISKGKIPHLTIKY